MFPTTLLADSVVCAARARPLVRRPVAASAARLPRVPRVPRWSLARTLAVALAVLVVGGLGSPRAWPPLATVMSASMAPTIKTGDMVVMARLHGPARIGDIVEVSVP